MRWKRTLLAGALLGAFAAGVALAQSVVQDNLSGNEAWNAGQGPGGPTTGFITTNLLRNSTAKVATTLTTASSTFGVGALVSLNRGGNVLITAQPALITTLTAPANPVPDGAIAGICNVTGSNFGTTNIGYAPNTGQSAGSGVFTNNAIGTGACMYFQFNRANTTWYKIQ